MTWAQVLPEGPAYPRWASAGASPRCTRRGRDRLRRDAVGGGCICPRIGGWKCLTRRVWVIAVPPAQPYRQSPRRDRPRCSETTSSRACQSLRSRRPCRSIAGAVWWAP